jgi:hypothetical protein
MIHGKSKLLQLHPVWRDAVPRLLDQLQRSGTSGTVVTVYRDDAEQERRFAKGETNARAGESAHNVRRGRTPAALALDFVVSEGEDSEQQLRVQDWWASLGFDVIRGGVGPNSVPDPTHVQMPRWRDLARL